MGKVEFGGIFHEVVVSLKIIPTFALVLYQHGQLSICGDLKPRILTSRNINFPARVSNAKAETVYAARC